MTPSPPDTSESSGRYLALGDSYTIGEGVPAEERWPMQLTRALRSEGVAPGNPQIIATTGWTTDELSAGLDAANPTGPFDLVTLSIGVNDEYRGRSAEAYRPALSALIQRAVSLAGGRADRVVMVSIPDWSVTPFAAASDNAAPAQALGAFNTIGVQEARRSGVAFVDITPLSLTQGDLVVGDRLHPTGEAYAGWADLIVPAARAALQSDAR